MKNIIKILNAFMFSFLFSGLVCAAAEMPEVVAPMTTVLFLGSLVPLPSGVAMAGINISQVATELGAYFRVNNKEVRNMVYQEAQVSKYMKVITRVKGRFPAFHSVTGNVIQGFQSVWNEIGETKFKVNELIAYHQKVNFPVIPSDVQNTWLADLYAENMTPEQMPISQYIVQKELKPRVVADLEYLSGNGVYDSGDLATFGKSMNGLKKILADGVASATQPMYKVPLAALTNDNIVEQVEFFEDQIPTNVRQFITKIYMSTRNRDRYRRNYRNLYGTNTDYNKGASTMTYTGDREIIGLDCLNGSDVIFATPDNNFLKLIDIFDAPTVTDVQVLDYKVKIFMEFWLGIGFWMNQLVLCSVTQGSGSGLTTDNNLYYLPGQV